MRYFLIESPKIFITRKNRRNLNFVFFNHLNYPLFDDIIMSYIKYIILCQKSYIFYKFYESIFTIFTKSRDNDFEILLHILCRNFFLSFIYSFYFICITCADRSLNGSSRSLPYFLKLICRRL